MKVVYKKSIITLLQEELHRADQLREKIEYIELNREETEELHIWIAKQPWPAKSEDLSINKDKVKFAGVEVRLYVPFNPNGEPRFGSPVKP